MKEFGLMLRLMRALRSTGKAVIRDSGFCILKALLKTRKRGVYGSVLKKKRRYWTWGVHGDAINN